MENINKKKIVVLTGSGVSKESGIPTFRDSVDGLWENHNVYDVCTPMALKKDPEYVHNFYNELREKYRNAKPNKAHELIAELEKDYDVVVITQNVDNLHEQAGSTNVIHLHGEIMKCRDTGNTKKIFDIPLNEETGRYDTYPKMKINGSSVRPHVVFFGEEVPNITQVKKHNKDADIVLIIGTSFNVWSLDILTDGMEFGSELYYIDPYPSQEAKQLYNINIIEDVATKGMEKFIELIKEK